MLETLRQNGFTIIKQTQLNNQICELQKEVDRLAQNAKSACVRHIRQKSSIIDNLSKSPHITNLLPKGMIPVRSILFDKNAKENWPVAWHQDLTIALKQRLETEGYGPWSEKDGVSHVQPPDSVLKNMITVRLHLDNTTSANGALKVIPRSHIHGKLTREQQKEFLLEQSITCECQAGDILLMNPLILHSSKRSNIVSRRRIIHLEFANPEDLDESLSWHEAH